MGTGRPCRGPSRSPRMTASSAARAASRARSLSQSRKALMAGLISSMRERTAWVSSTGESCLSRIAAVSSVAGVRESSGGVMVGRPFELRMQQRNGGFPNVQSGKRTVQKNWMRDGAWKRARAASFYKLGPTVRGAANGCHRKNLAASIAVLRPYNSSQLQACY